MAELADAPDSKSGSERSVGSTPTARTKFPPAPLKGLEPPESSPSMMLLRSFRLLYVQVLVAIALGILVGYVWPETGVALKPLGDAFVRLIKMVIAPVIFCTVAAGIARMSDMKAFGRLGLRTLILPRTTGSVHGLDAVTSLVLGVNAAY